MGKKFSTGACGKLLRFQPYFSGVLMSFPQFPQIFACGKHCGKLSCGKPKRLTLWKTRLNPLFYYSGACGQICGKVLWKTFF